MIVREPLQVAKRTLILGALSFRASLEVTQHPRVVPLSRQLTPWLRDLGVDDELDPIEKQLLVTPFGQLTKSQKIDANLAGEAAVFFCWTLNLAGPPPVAAPADQSELVTSLNLLRPEASRILQSASLRANTDLEAACKQFVLIRSSLQESRIESPGREIVRRVNLQRLTDVGLTVTDAEQTRASDTVTAMSPDEQRQAAGLYFVRDHAALWLFSSRLTYFESDDDSTEKDEG